MEKDTAHLKTDKDKADEPLTSHDLFAEFRAMLHDAYMQNMCPSVDCPTRYLLRLKLTEEQNEIWDRVMNPKANDRAMTPANENENGK